MSSKTKTKATKEEATPSLVPKLRFPEFRDAAGWSQVQLIDTTDRSVKWSFIGGPFGSNLKSSDYVADGVRIIQLQNIGDGEFCAGYSIFTSIEKADELLCNNIYPGDIIMSKMGDPVGRACLIPDIHERYVMCSDGIRLVVNEDKNDKYFIYSLVNSPPFRSVVEKTATGSTRKRIGLDELKSLPVWLPKKPEQHKIASCLSSLDSLITAQTEKLSALKTYKKGLMQQLFPREGETVPRLRFPEFMDAGEWENKPLSACLDYQQPTPYLVSDTNYSPAFKTPVLTAGKTFILGYTDEEHGIFSADLPVIIFDDFTTATQFVEFPFKAKSSAMKILKAKNGADIKFMYETLQTLSYEVGAHERHWISNFAPMLVLVPKPAEQQKIASCLSSLDSLITAQTEKLSALKTHKKGLMQGLFPNVIDP